MHFFIKYAITLSLFFVAIPLFSNNALNVYSKNAIVEQISSVYLDSLQYEYAKFLIVTGQKKIHILQKRYSKNPQCFTPEGLEKEKQFIDQVFNDINTISDFLECNFYKINETHMESLVNLIDLCVKNEYGDVINIDNLLYYDLDSVIDVTEEIIKYLKTKLDFASLEESYHTDIKDKLKEYGLRINLANLSENTNHNIISEENFNWLCKKRVQNLYNIDVVVLEGLTQENLFQVMKYNSNYPKFSVLVDFEIINECICDIKKAYLKMLVPIDKYIIK
ncbi:hypothetical protein [Lewinella sp. 4G2]|uniref:hypothetical protein n=1 Tax=Lewinella sp. 4G2 TaxID=1803372 RepID=UPI0007DE6204|nr:hypothetical protein [Lewinella sp. 4G2]OAV45105.1 hypothetical protein A3850_011665 [Lewinella sp. 4G2]